jgi:hypothetical protein
LETILSEATLDEIANELERRDPLAFALIVLHKDDADSTCQMCRTAGHPVTLIGMLSIAFRAIRKRVHSRLSG